MRQPAAFVAHGAGPLPLLGHASQAGLTKWLSGYAATLSGSRPKAILVISGHWEVCGRAAVHYQKESFLPKLLFRRLKIGMCSPPHELGLLPM